MSYVHKSRNWKKGDTAIARYGGHEVTILEDYEDGKMNLKIKVLGIK